MGVCGEGNEIGCSRGVGRKGEGGGVRGEGKGEGGRGRGLVRGGGKGSMSWCCSVAGYKCGI